MASPLLSRWMMTNIPSYQQRSYSNLLSMISKTFIPPDPIQDDPTSHILDLNGKRCRSDPFKLLSPQLDRLNIDIRSLLGSRNPTLDTIAKYYVSPPSQSKHIRPLIVLLVSQATHQLSPSYGLDPKNHQIDRSISSESILTDHNPSSSSSSNPSTVTKNHNPSILPTQRRLAEISEMIHVASLLHDDVIDHATSRRSMISAPSKFGNKLTILAGDFLLARASVGLSRLGSLEVVELISSTISNLVEGELMQVRVNEHDSKDLNVRRKLRMENYIEKTYLKTASLIAKTARCATILGGCGVSGGWKEGEKVKDGVYEYGKHLGIAFQIIDDVLDFTIPSSILGKPSNGTDLKLGLATAPTLYASETFPELLDLIDRRFSHDQDVERAQDYVRRSDGIQKSTELAQEHAKRALESIRSCGIPDNEPRQALERLTNMVIDRIK